MTVYNEGNLVSTYNSTVGHPEHAAKLKMALAHARRGIRVFPVHSIDENGSCTCLKGANCRDKGKHPRISDNLKNATTDENTIRGWWERWPDANIAAPTRAESGMWVLDVDPRHGGVKSLKRLIDKHGNLGAWRVVRTGGGGWHLYFEDPGFKIKSVANALGPDYPGLDVKGDGGYILLPPSNHESGGTYELIRDGEPGPAPEWLLEIVRDNPKHHDALQRTSRAPVSADLLDGPAIVEGTRNDSLTSIAGKLHDDTRSLEELVEELYTINAARCPSPLPLEEIKKIAKSIHERPPCRRASQKPTPEVIEMLTGILAAWWEADWSGPGGPSERDVLLAWILLGLQCGMMMPADAAVEGVVVRVAFRQAAELAQLGGAGTAHRAFSRLRVKGWCRGGGNGMNRWRNAAGSIVLLTPPRKTEHSPTTGETSSGGVSCVSPCAPPSAPRGRHSAPGLKRIATKRRIEAVDYLERAGGWLHEEELASMLGIKRVRDVRRRYLEPLEVCAVVECFGEEWRLTDSWVAALQRVFDEERELERTLYGGKTAHERLKERHQGEQDRYRNRSAVIAERAPTSREMRAYRESYPERRQQAIEAAMARLFLERPEYRSRRPGQVACALVWYLPDHFPRGQVGVPKDSEVAAVLDGYSNERSYVA